VAGSRVLGLANLRLCVAEVARESCVFGAKPFRPAAIFRLSGTGRTGSAFVVFTFVNTVYCITLRACNFCYYLQCTVFTKCVCFKLLYFSNV